jgi:large subunit ribosomal protein L25
MASVNLSATKREGSGKGVARRLRVAGQVPGVLYGHGTEVQSVSVGDLELRQALSTTAGIRAVLQLKVTGKAKPLAVLVKELQRHPLTRSILHVDLLSIDLSLPVEVSVPIKPLGIPIGTKAEGGNLEWQRRELQVRVLPTKIPEFIEIDISEMHLNDALHVGDIEVSDAELLEDAKLTVCSVKTTRMSIVEATVEDGEGEGEGEGAEAAEGTEATGDGDGAEGGDAES